LLGPKSTLEVALGTPLPTQVRKVGKGKPRGEKLVHPRKEQEAEQKHGGVVGERRHQVGHFKMNRLLRNSRGEILTKTSGKPEADSGTAIQACDRAH